MPTYVLWHNYEEPFIAINPIGIRAILKRNANLIVRPTSVFGCDAMAAAAGGAAGPFDVATASVGVSWAAAEAEWRDGGGGEP